MTQWHWLESKQCDAILVTVTFKTVLLLLQWYSWPMLSIQSVQTFFSAITFALTLLLVFKTNSSYARWWEARKDVGQLVSLVHDIMRQVRTRVALLDSTEIVRCVPLDCNTPFVRVASWPAYTVSVVHKNR